jgi:hypothetical protein
MLPRTITAGGSIHIPLQGKKIFNWVFTIETNDLCLISQSDGTSEEKDFFGSVGQAHKFYRHNWLGGHNQDQG